MITLQGIAIAESGLDHALQHSLVQGGYANLAQVAQGPIADLLRLQQGDLAPILAIQDRIVHVLTGRTASASDRYPGLVRASLRYQPYFTNTPIAALEISERILRTIRDTGVDTLETLCQRTPAQWSDVLDADDTREILAALYDLISSGQARLPQFDGFGETLLGSARIASQTRTLRQRSISVSSLRPSLIDTLTDLGFDSLADLSETSMEVFRDAYGFDNRTIADLSLALDQALTEIHPPFSLAGPALIARHVHADLGSRMDDGVRVDSYAISDLLNDALEPLHEDTVFDQGRWLWHRIDTGPLDRDPGLLALADLLAEHAPAAAGVSIPRIPARTNH